MNLMQYRCIGEKDFRFSVQTENLNRYKLAGWFRWNESTQHQMQRLWVWQLGSKCFNVLWIQNPAVLFCLFFFLPVLTIQLLSAGNIHGFSPGYLLSLTCSQPSTSNISSCWEDATCNIFHGCQQWGFINQPLGGAETGMDRQKMKRIAGKLKI